MARISLTWQYQNLHAEKITMQITVFLKQHFKKNFIISAIPNKASLIARQLLVKPDLVQAES